MSQNVSDLSETKISEWHMSGTDIKNLVDVPGSEIFQVLMILKVHYSNVPLHLICFLLLFSIFNFLVITVPLI
jgi:hypothetical protein